MINVNLNELAQNAAKEISQYLIPGMHHSTPEGQKKIAEIIKANLFPPETCISEKTWKTLAELDDHERESAKVNHEIK